MPEVTTPPQVERIPGGGPHHHLAALALTEGPEHQRIGIAWLDGCPGSPAVELTIDLAPGHRDLPDVVALVREAADAAAELDVGHPRTHPPLIEGEGP